VLIGVKLDEKSILAKLEDCLEPEWIGMASP
jgi:hypothetical protein